MQIYILFYCPVFGGNFTTSVLLPAVKDAGDYIIKLWSTYDSPSSAPTISSSNMNRVSRSGEWILYEKTITLEANASATIVFNCSSITSDQYVDDIRMQPKESQSICYVYDNKNLRLLAQFDDQHFASIFQYNSEGKLLRKLKETTRGVKTVAETDYYTPSADRPQGKAGKGMARYEVSTALNASTSGQATKSGNVYVKDVLENMKSFKYGNIHEKEDVAGTLKPVESGNMYVKDVLGNIKKENGSKSESNQPNERIKNMLERGRKNKIDTMAAVKFDIMNIHATPDQVNAKIIGVDTIKMESSKNNDKKKQ